jgi:Tfp pilus assembly protein PilF
MSPEREETMKILIIAMTVSTLALLNGASGWAGMGQAGPLKTQPGSAATKHNEEGIKHYTAGHWDVAKEHFVDAVMADPKSAEAHYNVALVLDKMGDHTGATEHFKMAKDLGKSNSEIQDSGILKAHLKMK